MAEATGLTEANESIGPTEPLADRALPERIVYPVLPGVTPSPAPPVRIFLGTEPAQFRAERVFLWSIRKFRNPARVYEIHLMRNLSGYRRWFWTTGFSNYRFATPDYAGKRGRAIYNDVDQLYLADPAELFDAEMGDFGYLTISERDTSVMLMDCERMAKIWKHGDAQRHRKHWMIDQSAARPGLAGPLPPEWNARDAEYRPGHSKCVHFTTLHLQPWRPFPKRFVYRENPVGHVFFELEAEADAAGFQVFDRHNPSEASRAVLREPTRVSPLRTEQQAVEGALRALVARTKPQTMLCLNGDARDSRPGAEAKSGVGQATQARLRSVLNPDNAAADGCFDGVACTSGLESVPPEDVPWVLDELFSRAGCFVFAAIACRRPARRRFPNPAPSGVGTRDWWEQHFSAISRQHPTLHWQILLSDGPDFASEHVESRQGGRFPGEALPMIWVLADRKPGHSTQSIGLADELGWPYERISLDLGPLSELPNAWLGASTLGLRRGAARKLAGAVPDLIIAAGRRTAPVARWMRAQARGRTKVVQLGRIGVSPPDAYDLSVVPNYAGLLPHPQRLVITAPLTRVRRQLLDEARERWGCLFEGKAAPRIALLVGGDAPHYRLRPETAAAMGRAVMREADRCGGSVFVTTSRRTPRAAERALRQAMPGATHIHTWADSGKAEANPYLGYMALADLFVVTGESASMLAEACATGKPVYIYEIPRGVPGWRGLGPRLADRLLHRVVTRAARSPLSRRGFARPQRGLELLLSKALARGLLRPACDFSRLHDDLVERGHARRFDGSLERFEPTRSKDLARVADRVRELLGLGDL